MEYDLTMGRKRKWGAIVKKLSELVKVGILEDEA